MAQQSYAEYLQALQQAHPEWPPLEGQTPEICRFEQQIFLSWLQSQLENLNTLIPAGGWRCDTSLAHMRVSGLSIEITARKMLLDMQQ